MVTDVTMAFKFGQGPSGQAGKPWPGIDAPGCVIDNGDDAQYESAADRVRRITRVPGGVGPTMILEQTIMAAELALGPRPPSAIGISSGSAEGSHENCCSKA
jgi:hypothetical protein